MSAPILVSADKLRSLECDHPGTRIEHHEGYRWLHLGINTFRTIIRDGGVA